MIITLDIVGLLKTLITLLLCLRGRVPCYCDACTSEIPSLEAIRSYLTSSPPKWIPKNKAGDYLQSKAKHTAICNRDPDCDRSPVVVYPACAFSMLPSFSSLFWLGWQLAGGVESGETALNRAFRLALFDLCATAPWRQMDYCRLQSVRRVETCPHGWSSLSWSYPAAGLAGGMTLLHHCVTSYS